MKQNNDTLLRLDHVLSSFIVSKTIPSLSRILEEPVTYYLKKTQMVSISNLDELSLNFEEMNAMSAVYVKCNGDLQMGILWYMLEEESRPLASKLLSNLQLNKTDHLFISSISEIGNILTASIVNAISDNMGYEIWSSLPGFAIESMKTLLEAIISDLEDSSNTLVLSSVEFCGAVSGLRLQMLLIQDPKEVKKLIA
ncbi:MAG TPA: hypothetical protein VJ771_04950 [Candidatus Nitrosotalea sp.]|nr:hypothetical protein [Candidatus Nitrosotalea sp.]